MSQQKLVEVEKGNNDGKNSVPSQQKIKIIIKETFWDGLCDIEKNKSRNWVFTINNPTKEDEEDLVKIENECKWLGFQLEKGQNGTPHFQGFLQLHNARSRKGVAGFLKRAWLAVQKGTDEECMAYCCNPEKEGFLAGPYMKGRPCSGMGKRGDLQEMIDFMKSGGAIKLWEVKEKFPVLYLRYSKYIETFLGTKKPNPFKKKEIAIEYLEDKDAEGLDEKEFGDVYIKDETKWWDDYMGEETIIFRNGISDTLLKKFRRGYEFLGEKKGMKGVLVHPDRVLIIGNAEDEEEKTSKELTLDEKETLSEAWKKVLGK